MSQVIPDSSHIRKAAETVGAKSNVDKDELYRLVDLSFAYVDRYCGSLRDARRHVLNGSGGYGGKLSDSRKRERNAFSRAMGRVFELLEAPLVAPPLTASEIKVAQNFSHWLYSRKPLAPSDTAGKPFSTKNLGDVTDQYLGVSPKIRSLYDRDQLMGLVRRYRSKKAGATRAKKVRKANRLEKQAVRKAEQEMRRQAREAKRARELELKSRQGVLNF